MTEFLPMIESTYRVNAAQSDARNQRHFDGRLWSAQDRDEASGPVWIRQRAQRRTDSRSMPCSQTVLCGPLQRIHGDCSIGFTESIRT